MAKLHKDLTSTQFGCIEFDICPKGIGLPAVLHEYAVPIASTEAKQDAYLKDMDYPVPGTWEYDRATKTHMFEWCDEILHIPGTMHMATARMLFFETFAPPDINPHSYQFFQVEDGDVVVDGGACEGFYALDCLTKGAKRVLAFEPMEGARACLRRSFDERVDVYQALGSYNGVVPFHVHDAGSSVRGKMDNIGGSTTADMITLDSLALPRVDIIKMDIEGSEFDALVGARETIGQFKPKLLISAYHRYMDAFLIYRFLLSIRPDYEILLWGRQTIDRVKSEKDMPYKPQMLVAW